MRKHAQGFSIIEVLIVVAVAGILMTLALPSYSSIVNKRAVTNAAEQVSIFMALGRSESVKRNEPISLTFDNTGTPFCAGMSSGTTACDCKTANACTLTTGAGGNTATTEIRLLGSDYENLKSPSLTFNGTTVTSLLMTFDPVRGVLESPFGTRAILITSDNDNYALQVGISQTGRINVCTPTNKPVPGYKSC